MAYHVQQASISEITEQLKQEEERLKLLKDNLSRSRKLKEDMLDILQSFENRLQGLESAVLPLYEHTGKLQRRQQNISKTLKSIDSTLNHYKFSTEFDGAEFIDADLSTDKYLKKMSTVKDALIFFTNEKNDDAQLSHITTIYEMGCNGLDTRFKDLLIKGAMPVKPDHIVDCLDDNFEVNTQRLGRLEFVNEKDVESLKKITQWLLINTESPNFLKTFSEVRGAAMIRQLQNIEESRKTQFSSGGGPLKTVMNSPKLDRKRGKISYDWAVRKVSKATDPGYKRANTMAALEPITEFPGEQESELFLILLGCFDALFQADCEMLHKIVANTKYEANLQRALVIKPLNYLLIQGENVVDAVRKSLIKQDAKSILCLLPIVKYLHAHFTQLDSLSKNAHSELNSKFIEVFKSVDSLCVKGLEEFVEAVKSDQVKSAPPDGTVHQITSNTISFLKQLMEQRNSLTVLLADTSTDSARIAVPKLFARILSALGLNLRNKSTFYTDPSLRALFMLNNHNHILKSLKHSGILKMVCEQNREVQSYYFEQVNEYKRQFLTCWSRLLVSFAEIRGDASPALNNKIADKDREMIKSAFSSFNRELEAVCQAQREYTVPDLELANDIKRESRDVVLKKYQTFYDKYHASGFAKNTEKYVRYKPDDVALLIDRLFDASA